MPRKVYDYEDERKVLELWIRTPMNTSEISEELSFNKTFVQKVCKGIDSRHEKKKRLGLKVQKPKLYEQMLKLWKHTDMGKKTIAHYLGLGESTCIKHLKNVPYDKGIVKFDGKYKKGSESWNKNTRGLTSANSGSFKKGVANKCNKKIYAHGEPQIVRKKTGQLEVYTTIPEKRVVTEPNSLRSHEAFKRVTYASYVWKKHYGAIPTGYIVWHKDQDPLNNDISNLTLITRRKMLKMNRNHEPVILEASCVNCKTSRTIGPAGWRVTRKGRVRVWKCKNCNKTIQGELIPHEDKNYKAGKYANANKNAKKYRDKKKKAKLLEERRK